MTIETKSKSQRNWTEQFDSAQKHKQNRKYKKALQALEEALALARKHSLTEETFLSLKALADVQRLSGHLKQAGRAEEEALAMSSQLFAARAAAGGETQPTMAESKESPEESRMNSNDLKSDRQAKPGKKSDKDKKHDKAEKVKKGEKTDKSKKETKSVKDETGKKSDKKAKSTKEETRQNESEEDKKSCRSYMEKAESLNDFEERAECFRKAIKAGRKEVGKDWEKKYAGVHWLALETRPIMQAMACLARELRWLDEVDEAIEIYETLLALNPNDNQGVRYELAPCLLEAGKYEALEAHLRKYGSESAAIFLYTRALYLYQKTGNSKEARDALQRAFKRNAYVPIFLSDVVEMPDERPTFIGIGDENEALSYVMEYSYLWEPEQTAWLANTLEKDLYKSFADDPELVSDVLKELRLE